MRAQSQNLLPRPVKSRRRSRLRRWVFRGLAALALGVAAALTARPLAQLPEAEPTPLKDLDFEVLEVVEALLEQIDDFGAQELRAQLLVARQGETQPGRIILTVPQDTQRTLLDSYTFPVYATAEVEGREASFALQIVDGRLRALLLRGAAEPGRLPDPQTFTFHYGG
ncbi:MAG: hypothetical protein Q4D79_05010 [Propionibacteriaceae bacterium]|nr:hypothetical protein [Propionibacteriaceae bacterium]